MPLMTGAPRTGASSWCGSRLGRQPDCTSFAHVKTDKVSFVGTSLVAHLRLDPNQRSPVVTHPIAAFLETLRLWRRRARARQALANELADDAAAAGIHHELNISFWFLPPPC